MAKLKWDQSGERFFETGVDHGVLYNWDNKEKKYKSGVAWNGLTAVTESPEGAEETEFWADNIKYASMRSAETFGGTIEAYTYPPEFEVCDGIASPTPGMRIGQQPRESFGFTYRTLKMNDTSTTDDDSYLIHIWYGCTASPSEKAYETVNDSPDAITFSWEITSNPVDVVGFKPTSCLTLDSAKLPAKALKAVEDMLYGTEDLEGEGPILKTPDEIKALIEANQGE